MENKIHIKNRIKCEKNRGVAMNILAVSVMIYSFNIN